MKKYLKSLPHIVFFITFFASSQCDRVETLVFCDMTIIDGNSDGTPDGVINLYDEYTSQIGGTLAAGTWFDPGFNFALDEASGDLFLWDLDNASVTGTDYMFELTNPNCATGPTITLNVVLGPFSGETPPVIGPNGVNVQVCDIGPDPCGSMATFDLDQVFLSLPSPHLNGTWEYRGTSPNFIGIDGEGIFMAQVPYTAGPPLVDEEIFELFYVVPGLAPCTDQETAIKISVIREVFAGFANRFDICESFLVSGSTYENINLRDDGYLVNEDIEGTWLSDMDPTGQISDPGDSIINLVEVYNDLVATNPRFGCQTYDYTFFVASRSTVCEDNESTISFTFHEELRPFSQTVPDPVFCVGDETVPDTINLYDYIEFTSGFDYPSDCCTNWTLVSGPSNLDLMSNTVGGECAPDPLYTHLGTINTADLTNADAGTYVFEYLVRPEVNCGCSPYAEQTVFVPPTGCSTQPVPGNLCGVETAEVTIVINPFNYAGEDTPTAPVTALEFCETASPLDLIALLNIDGVNGPVYTGPLGTWTDLDTGMTITSPFTVPDIDGNQTFNFNYSTTTAPINCPDSANLTITIYEEYNPGIDTNREVCESDASFNLFDELDGNPSDSGTWILPNGTLTADNNYTFDPATADAGNYTYVVPDNTSISNPSIVLCPGDQAIFTITILEGPDGGADQTGETCLASLQYDLLDLVDAAADAGGTFNDVGATGALSGSIVDLTLLTAGSYMFEYEVPGNSACGPNVAILTLTVFDEFSSGTDTTEDVCEDDASFNIFDELEGSPSANGTWTSPDGTVSTDNNVIFDPATSDAGVYIYIVPDLVSPMDPTVVICAGGQTEMTITIFQNANPGAPNNGTACLSDLQFDLATLVDPAADTGGTFADITVPPTNALTGSVVDLTLLTVGNYNFQYIAPGNSACVAQTATLDLTVTDLLAPTVDNETFCALEAATLADITVNGASDFEWFDTATSTDPLDINTILVGGENYFVAATDVTSTCFSSRVELIASITPIGQGNCVTNIPDGVSPNDDSQNDDLDLSNLPQVFPNYEIKIFNRYGTAVFIGNTNTAFFSGKSNVSLSVGENLPSGTYFYVFDPKDNITKPFQGNFYLSR